MIFQNPKDVFRTAGFAATVRHFWCSFFAKELNLITLFPNGGLMNYSMTARDREVYQKFAHLALPRHTSYPAVPHWNSSFSAADWEEHIRTQVQVPFSLYAHIPFCQKLCYYCGCTKTILPKDHPRSSSESNTYLNHLIQELEYLRSTLSVKTLAHLHFGGGTPTYLSSTQLERLCTKIDASFDRTEDAEIACEIDPRATTLEHLKILKDFGVNRLSLGIQDFDPTVQKAVNRIQPFSEVAAFLDACRRLGFSSINFDLIYGLPFQTHASVAKTLGQVLSLDPDRMAFYRLAHIPELFRWQRGFVATDMPGSEHMLDFNLLAIETFSREGYEFLGLDHFAKPQDALAKAFRDRSLQRNFQGMSTRSQVPVIGVGPSAISSLRGIYGQNVANTRLWQSRIAQGCAVERGMLLSEDDLLRHDLLQELYCYRSIDLQAFMRRYGLSFENYFRAIDSDLEDLQDLGLISLTRDQLRLTRPLGELLVRVVAACFDRYLGPGAYRSGSQVGSAVG
jgi:oxygen-independent coproporphyrinogen-3 oxidase